MFIYREGFKKERREELRIAFNHPIAYHEKNGHKVEGCVGCDISLGGMKVKCNHFLPLNKEVELDTALKGSPNTIHVHARVVWSQRVAHSETYYIGLEYDQIDDLSKRRLSRFVHADHCSI